MSLEFHTGSTEAELDTKSADAFRTISEVAEDLDIPQHVLRFWETRFGQIRPLKRGGGRRYYRPDDVDLLKGIRHLLYSEGYTIKGVQRILKEDGPKSVQAIGRTGMVTPAAAAPPAPKGPPVVSTEPDILEDEEEPITAPEPAPKRPRQPRGLSSLPLFGDFEDAPTGLGPESRVALEQALTELVECRRLLSMIKTDASSGVNG